MKVLLINGSPHEKGCTYTALSEVAATLNKEGVATEFFWLGHDPVAGCRTCGYCKKNGKCVIDDPLNELTARLDEFDGFIIGSPVYYAAPAGQLMAFLDRFFYVNHIRLAGKPAAGVVSCRRGGASAAFDRLNKYFAICSMPIVTSQYWNQVHGNKPDEVRRDLEGLQTMRTLGQNMAWLLKSIEAGKQTGVAKPVYEPELRTNFILPE